NGSLTLKGCTTLAKTAVCTSVGDKKGMIKLSSLSGELGVLEGGVEKGVSFGRDEGGEDVDCGGITFKKLKNKGHGGFEPIPGGETPPPEFKLKYPIKPLLGEPEPGYTPLVNPLKFVSGTTSYFETEVCVTGEGCKGPMPSGLETEITFKNTDHVSAF